MVRDLKISEFIWNKYLKNLNINIMFYTREEFFLIKSIINRYKISFTDAFQYLDDDTKDIIYQRLRDDLLY